MNHVERIVHESQLLAMIISNQFAERGVHFFTPGELSQQVAIMRHDAGRVIAPHVHTPAPREIVYTNEVLVIRRGRLRVDFYTREQAYLTSRELVAGDIILLITGGHGFEVLEDIDMIEVKQGPFMGEQDKTRFEAVSGDAIRLDPAFKG